jgi:hypothetical protein
MGVVVIVGEAVLVGVLVGGMGVVVIVGDAVLVGVMGVVVIVGDAVLVGGTGVFVGVLVGGTGVLVGGTGVFVGGTGVLVGGTGVLVGGTGVLVGGTGVFVGGTGVLVGGTGVFVGGFGVLVGGFGVLVDSQAMTVEDVVVKTVPASKTAMLRIYKNEFRNFNTALNLVFIWSPLLNILLKKVDDSFAFLNKKTGLNSGPVSPLAPRGGGSLRTRRPIKSTDQNFLNLFWKLKNGLVSFQLFNC